MIETKNEDEQISMNTPNTIIQKPFLPSRNISKFQYQQLKRERNDI